MPRTYTAHQIAQYFLAKTDEDAGDLMTNLKLQKLCYYAQGLALAARGTPLFTDRIEAWLHGPVVPSLYHSYKEHGSRAIPTVETLDLDAYDPADRQILDDTYDYYGQFSAWRLREMTHNEAPWKDAYREAPNAAISCDAMKNHFDDEVDDNYRAKYEKLSRSKE